MAIMFDYYDLFTFLLHFHRHVISSQIRVETMEYFESHKILQTFEYLGIVHGCLLLLFNVDYLCNIFYCLFEL